MSTFAAITSRTALTERDLERVAEITRRHATYVPSETRTYVHESRRSALVELCGFASKSVCDGPAGSLSSLTLFDGRSWTSGLGRFLTVGDMVDHPPAADEIQGSFVWVRIDRNGEIAIDYDPLVSVPLFHASNGAVSIISDRIEVCAEVVGAAVPDPFAASWVSLIGYVIGEATRFAEVRRVPVSASLRSRNGETLVGSTRKLAESGATFDELYQRYKSGVMGAFSAIVAEQGSIRLGLTGGKDSRAILALLLESGLNARTTFFVWDFAPEHGGGADAIVAKAIAERFGLTLEVMPRTSAQATAPSFESLLGSLRRHAFATQGRTGGWDRVGLATPSTAVSINGTYGEMFRHNYSGPAPETDHYSIDTTIFTLDTFGALRPGAKDALADNLYNALAPQALPTSTSRDYADLRYMMNWLPNIGGTLNAVQRIGQATFSPLYNRFLVPLAFKLNYRDRHDETIHYRIISDVSPALASMAFAHDEWTPRIAQSPAQVRDPPGVPRFGGWQHTLLTSSTLLESISSFLADTSGSWESLIDKEIVLRTMAAGPTIRQISSVLGMLVSNINENERVTGPKVGFPRAVAP